MNKNIMFVLAGGFVVAIFVSVIMVSLMRPGQPDQKLVKNEKTHEVLVATRDLAPGDKVNASNTQWKKWPADAVFPGMQIKTSQTGNLQGRINRPVGKGEPVLASAIIEGNSNMLAASLKKGYRAVALNVNAASTAGGFITPGNMVDVIVTFAMRTNPEEEQLTREFVDRYISETILEDVRVMAIDQESGAVEQGSKVARTVTLEVDNKGARKLMLAKEMGELSLALRALGDDQKLKDKEEMVTDVTTAKIYGEIDALRSQDPVSSGRSVRILNSNGVQSIPVITPASSRSAPGQHLAQK